jgi:fumarylacetoacetase
MVDNPLWQNMSDSQDIGCYGIVNGSIFDAIHEGLMTLTTKPLHSFIESAADSLFPIQSLPYGVFHHHKKQAPHIGTAIGDFILDLTFLEQEGVLNTTTNKPLFNQGTLNVFASEGPAVWSAVRQRIQSLLSSTNRELQDNDFLLSNALILQNEVTMLLPFKIEGFSDFYASEQHATNVGRLFRGNENALLPNWKYLPVGYNGRASTVFSSGTNITRPRGQIKKPDIDKPIFSATQKLDFELELGIFVGVGNQDGSPIHVEDATSHIFGLVLLNDWSARDIQSFEYQPLGPFLSKSFATSISSWVIPLEALQHCMVPLAPQSPEPVTYLQESSPKLPDIKLKVEIQPKGSNIKTTLCETNATALYWSMAQMLAHHTVNNCIMRPGDLLGTGTISGPNKENWGSLLEISFNGSAPITLNDGQTRTFLEDGDKVIITGYSEGAGYHIGFGRLEGLICRARES